MASLTLTASVSACSISGSQNRVVFNANSIIEYVGEVQVIWLSVYNRETDELIGEYQQVVNTNGQAQFRLTHLPNGDYYAQAEDSAGSVSVLKYFSLVCIPVQAVSRCKIWSGSTWVDPLQQTIKVRSAQQEWKTISTSSKIYTGTQWVPLSS